MSNDQRKTLQEQLAELAASGNLRFNKNDPTKAKSNDNTPAYPPSPSVVKNQDKTYRQDAPEHAATYWQVKKLFDENSHLNNLILNLEKNNNELINENKKLREIFLNVEQESELIKNKQKIIEEKTRELKEFSEKIIETIRTISNDPKINDITSPRIVEWLKAIQEKEKNLRASIDAHARDLGRLFDVDEREKLVKLEESSLAKKKNKIERQEKNIQAKEKELEIEETKINNNKILIKKSQKDISFLKSENRKYAFDLGALKSENLRLLNKLSKAEGRLRNNRKRHQVRPPLNIEDWAVVHWMLWDVEIDRTVFPKTVACEGDGPWDSGDIRRLLGHQRFKVGKCGARDAAEILIVGRKNWDPGALERHIANRGSSDLYILTQELFVAALLCGRNPLDERDDAGVEDIIWSFAKGHPVIDWLLSLQFPWPDVGFSDEPGAGEFEHEVAEESPLLKLGYRVGVGNGQPEALRQQILSDAFNDELPFVLSKKYMEGWSESGSRLRLRRIAWHIAMLVRQRQRRKNHAIAVREWQSDLDWLKRKFYKRLMRFTWPYQD